MAISTTLVAGLGPTLRAGRDLEATLRDGGRGATASSLGNASRTLVVIEVALAAALMIAAGVSLQSALNAEQAVAAFESERAVTAWISLPHAGTGGDGLSYPDHPARLRFSEDLLGALASEPTLERAAVVTFAPGRAALQAPFRVDGRPEPVDQFPEAGVAVISEGALATMGVAAVRGREFVAADVTGAEPVALVTSTFAAIYLDGREPVGSRIRLGETEHEPWLRVIGVAPDLWSHPRDPARRTGILLPLAQSGDGDPALRLGPWGLSAMRVIARGRTSDTPTLALLRDAVFGIDRALPLIGGESLSDYLRTATGRYRVWGSFYVTFAAAALLLGGLGVGSVVSYRVAVRRHEIGVRRALGATAAAVRGAVLRSTLLEIGLGAAAGFLLRFWLSTGMGRVLYGTEGPSAPLFLAVGAVLGTTGLLAAWVPARRAAQVDPVVVLRGADNRR